MRTRPQRLEDDLKALSSAYPLSVSEDGRWVTIHSFKLPPGYQHSTTDILMETPRDYPCTPPGVATHIYIDADLRFKGRKLRDVYEGVNPGWGHWAWFCYQSIKWNPRREDLIRFFEMVRADITEPKTK